MCQPFQHILGGTLLVRLNRSSDKLVQQNFSFYPDKHSTDCGNVQHSLIPDLERNGFSENKPQWWKRSANQYIYCVMWVLSKFLVSMDDSLKFKQYQESVSSRIHQNTQITYSLRMSLWVSCRCFMDFKWRIISVDSATKTALGPRVWSAQCRTPPRSICIDRWEKTASDESLRGYNFRWW